MSRETVTHDRMNYEAVAEFFGERGWDLERIFVSSVGADGQPVFNFSDEAVGELGRATRADPNLYARLFRTGSLH